MTMPLARSTLALVLLRYAEPTMRHEPMLLAKARKTWLVNLASRSTMRTLGKPAQERRHMSRMIVAASAAVAVALVGTACTRGRHDSESCQILPPLSGARQSSPPPIIPPRRDGRGGGWKNPRGPSWSALVCQCWHLGGGGNRRGDGGGGRNPSLPAEAGSEPLVRKPSVRGSPSAGCV